MRMNLKQKPWTVLIKADIVKDFFALLISTDENNNSKFELIFILFWFNTCTKVNIISMLIKNKK